MIAKRIIRIRSPWLRVPLWSVWHPLMTLGMLLWEPHRALRPAFWQFARAAYLMGIDGLKD